MNAETIYAFSGERVECGNRKTQFKGQLVVLPWPNRIIGGRGSIGDNSHAISCGFVGFLASINGRLAMFLWQCYGSLKSDRQAAAVQSKDLHRYLVYNPPGAFYYLTKDVIGQEIGGQWQGYWTSQVVTQVENELKEILLGNKSIEQVEGEMRQASSPFFRMRNHLMMHSTGKPTIELHLTFQGQCNLNSLTGARLAVQNGIRNIKN